MVYQLVLLTRVCSWPGKEQCSVRDSSQWSLIHLSSFWVNLEQARVFTPSSLLCILLVGQLGRARGVVYSDTVLVKKEKHCGLLMWSQVF